MSQPTLGTTWKESNERQHLNEQLKFAQDKRQYYAELTKSIISQLNTLDKKELDEHNSKMGPEIDRILFDQQPAVHSLSQFHAIIHTDKKTVVIPKKQSALEFGWTIQVVHAVMGSNMKNGSASIQHDSYVEIVPPPHHVSMINEHNQRWESNITRYPIGPRLSNFLSQTSYKSGIKYVQIERPHQFFSRTFDTE